MLIDNPALEAAPDTMLQVIALLNGNSPETKRLQQGVYQIGHFGGGRPSPGYEEWPSTYDLGIAPYGVCDGIENILARAPELVTSERQFYITLTSVRPDPKSRGEGGGWRWHKWGPYIGSHTPQHEYLDDEEGIDEVFCYHIYEKLQ